MEAPLRMRVDEEEQEVMDMDLNTRRRSHHTHKLQTTSPTSSESSGTSESSNISFEDVLGDQNNHTNGTSNGENSTIVEDGSVIEENQVEAEKEEALVVEEVEEEISMDSSSVSFSTHNQGTNGISLHKNGHTVEFSFTESHAGSLEITSNSNSSSVSKSPDTAAGLKDLESLLDESSNNLNVASTDAYSALLDTLNNASKSVEGENGDLGLPKDAVPPVQEIGVEIKTDEIQNHVLKLENATTTSSASVGNENGHLHLLKEPLPEVEEFDVERVVQKQETHDFYCPNCNSCITKRVILKRRKRKIQEISSPSDEIVRQPPALEGNQGSAAASVDETTEERISAITCLSCFSIFLPTENGWLRRIFGRKPEVAAQPDATLTEPLLPSEEPVDPAGQGKAFPLWIVSCCQPSTERPVRPEPPVASKPAPGPDDSQPNTKLTSIIPGTSSPTEHGSGEKPDTDIVEPVEAAEPTTPQPSSVPGGDKTSSPSETKPEVAEEMFAQWFLNCCHPKTGGIDKPQISETLPKPKPDPVPGVGDDVEASSPTTSDPTTSTKPDPGIQVVGSEQLITPPADNASKPSEVPASKLPSESKFALWFVNCCQPQDRPQVLQKPDVEEPLPPSKPPRISSEKDIVLPFDAGSSPGADEASSPKPGPAPVEGNLPSSDPVSEVKPGGTTGTPLPDPPIQLTRPEDGAPQILTNVTRPDVSVPPNNTPQAPDGGDPPLNISSPQTPTHVIKPDDSIPPNLTSPPDSGKDEKLPPELNPPTRPDQDDISVVPESKPAPTPLPGEEVIIQMPHNEGAAKPTNLGVIHPGEGATSDNPREPLIDTSQECDVTSEDEPPTREPRPGVEIIKAIVYGGLLECITSLSVITSAAGGDATTLNIVALGLANVFGGLILLFHNLRVLKHEHGTKRYRQQLGEPGHYWLHAIVAVMSYLIFGLMAPIIYGFCYRKSDNKDNKLIVLASASLACIALLSAAKAHVRTPTASRNYTGTVFYYLGVGFSVSGLGYVAGHFINILLKKVGVFDPAAAAPEAGDVNGGLWASY